MICPDCGYEGAYQGFMYIECRNFYCYRFTKEQHAAWRVEQDRKLQARLAQDRESQREEPQREETTPFKLFMGVVSPLMQLDAHHPIQISDGMSTRVMSLPYGAFVWFDGAVLSAANIGTSDVFCFCINREWLGGEAETPMLVSGDEP